jgi:hypothetical protein
MASASAAASAATTVSVARVSALMDHFQGLITGGASDDLDKIREEAMPLLNELSTSLAEMVADDAQAVRRSVSKLWGVMKQEFSPVSRDAEWAALKERLDSAIGEERDSIGKALMSRLQAVQAAESTKHFERVAGTIDALVSHFVGDLSGGRSNRAKRAAKASSILSRHAGLNTIPGVPVDSNGNALGDEGDLCRDGAFEGMSITVVVLQAYTMDFDSKYMRTALEKKGFVVKILTPPFVSPDELDQMLATASQCWIISSNTRTLSDDIMDVCVRHWRGGLGLYVLGDNLPFLFDANQVLGKMGFPTLHGNQPGDKYLRPSDMEHDRSPGFAAGDLVTTGIMTLFEGITVAWMVEADLAPVGLKPILRESTDGRVIVARRDAMDGCGPVCVDGAFTKLYYRFDEAGSARLVTNMAIFLGVDMSAMSEEDKVGEAPTAELDMTGAFHAVCDFSDAEGVATVALAPMEDRTALTGDMALDNALGFSRLARKVVLPHSYELSVARGLLSLGSNPFTHQPLELIVPAVKLDSWANWKAVGELLCHGLLGGLSMPRYAYAFFYAACSSIVAEGADHKGVFEFFCREIEANLKVKGTFEGDGPELMLGEGMEFYAKSVGPDQQRRIFSWTAAVGLALLRRSSVGFEYDEMRPVVRDMTRRSLLRAILGGVLQQAKADTFELRGKLQALMFGLHDGLQGEEFELSSVLPLRGGGRVIPLAELCSLAFGALGESVMEDCALLEAKLADDGGPLLTDAHSTYIACLVMHREANFQCSFDSFLQQFVSTRPGAAAYFGREWVDPLTVVNAVFSVFHDCESVPTPPFVTPFGPSVFRWSDGSWLVDPTAHNWAEEPYFTELRRFRGEALRAVWKTSNLNGYPTRFQLHEEGAAASLRVADSAHESALAVLPLVKPDPSVTPPQLFSELALWRQGAPVDIGSGHCSLHRAVQQVLLSSEHHAETERTERMMLEVALRVRAMAGNIFDPALSTAIPETIDSFLECRRRGMREPLMVLDRVMVALPERVGVELELARAAWEEEGPSSRRMFDL